MIIYIFSIIIFLAAFLIYSVLKIRFTPSVSVGRPAATQSGDAHRLYKHVEHLSVHIGSRSVYEYDKITATKDYIVSSLKDFGCEPALQTFIYNGREYSNIIVSMTGSKSPAETVIIGAHYDTVYGTPGADDNASAVAVLLEICRISKNFSPARTLKLIFFVIEEPPVFRSKYMGSYVYAAEAKARNENIKSMICLEMLGYYADKKGGQSFPLPLMNMVYPSTPNFIAIVGNMSSRDLVEKVKKSLRESSSIHIETLSTVSFIPGVDFSDHRSFWKMGYPAVMITDTAFYRNPNYHAQTDSIDTLNFDKMNDLLNGLLNVVRNLTLSSSA
ncbi:MAG TPA: M28 family peptidase [Syntrophales bacterium]|nr:M28 family peptidase [Syntrophales bacterium]